jgi:hypothetical protein
MLSPCQKNIKFNLFLGHKCFKVEHITFECTFVGAMLENVQTIMEYPFENISHIPNSIKSPIM